MGVCNCSVLYCVKVEDCTQHFSHHEDRSRSFLLNLCHMKSWTFASPIRRRSEHCKTQTSEKEIVICVQSSLWGVYMSEIITYWRKRFWIRDICSYCWIHYLVIKFVDVFNKIELFFTKVLFSKFSLIFIVKKAT